MARAPKCKVCGAEILEALTEVSGAVEWLCLECSGATLADFMDEDEYAEKPDSRKAGLPR
jgi:hypothetical protein